MHRAICIKLYAVKNTVKVSTHDVKMSKNTNRRKFNDEVVCMRLYT